MQRLTDLFDLVGGRWPVEEQGSAQRLQMAIRAAFAALGFAALYGVAAGSTDPVLALGNAWKLPMVVFLSTMVALPAGLLAWKLTGAARGASALVLGVAAGNFAATLVLASLSPLVALYYHSSAFWGGPLAMGTTVLALVVGMGSAGRLVLRDGHARLPFGVLAGVQLLALLQFVHIASPILPETTVFDRGADALVDR
jgi:hypothetical protein